MKIARRTLSVLLLTIATSCGTATDSLEQELGDDAGAGETETDCTKTQGYWKNHEEAWPVDSLLLGDTSYTKEQLLAIFRTPVKGNGLISLAHQLIAAKLNVANGAYDGDIGDEIAAADALIDGLVVPPIGGGHLATSVTSALNDALDGFNNLEGGCAPPPPPAPVCGNGVVETGEGCDDGNSADDDTCRNDCTPPPDEPCTPCPPPAPVCGNGVVETGEACDDGNSVDDDTCRNDCTLCPTPPPPPAPVCGNGVVESGEACDDGNTVDDDTCANDCTVCPVHERSTSTALH